LADRDIARIACRIRRLEIVMPEMVRKRSIPLACGAVALLAFTFPTTVSADAPISCTGAFARDADEAAVRSAFGDAATIADDVYIGEGYSEPGTVVFPDDAARRIEILWHDPDARSRPSAVILREESTRRVAVPASPAIILRIGMTLAEVEAANGRPFELLGFDWDYGGSAVNWREGALAGQDDDCIVALRFDPDPDSPGHAHAEVSGDRLFLSSDTAMREVSPTVSSITLSWPQ
jgi:hypothetical protein